jgi:HD-GYP domain-containing protein (c-di-GMP phosphodiesterase class II)
VDPDVPRILRPIAGGADALRIARAVAMIAGVREGADPAHAERVAELAAAIAIELGLDEPVVHRCGVAGWLHDVGMVALPDSAFSATAVGGESPELRVHPVLGADLVRRVPELAEAALAIRHHHEHWDGSGYPDGLAGTDIPVEARVLAVADLVAAALPAAAADPRVRKQAAARVGAVAGTLADPDAADAAAAVLAAEATAHGEYLRIA